VKKIISILPLLFGTFLAFAQSDDLPITVRKKTTITIDPDNMYFDSRTSRKFILHGAPPGSTVKVSFLGFEFSSKDTTLMLQPLIVYRDSDVIKNDKGYSRLTSSERTTKGDCYISEVHIKIFDSKGIQIGSIVRNCCIKPEPYMRARANVNRWPPYPRDSVQLNKIRKLGQ
jgi:hypothetical protein